MSKEQNGIGVLEVIIMIDLMKKNFIVALGLFFFVHDADAMKLRGGRIVNAGVDACVAADAELDENKAPKVVKKKKKKMQDDDEDCLDMLYAWCCSKKKKSDKKKEDKVVDNKGVKEIKAAETKVADTQDDDEGCCDWCVGKFVSCCFKDKEDKKKEDKGAAAVAVDDQGDVTGGKRATAKARPTVKAEKKNTTVHNNGSNNKMVKKIALGALSALGIAAAAHGFCTNPGAIPFVSWWTLCYFAACGAAGYASYAL